MPMHEGNLAGLPAAAPTQVRRPWRSTARTIFQAAVALAVLFPVLVDQTGLQSEDFPWLAIPLAVAAAVTRVMALPQVEVFLRQFLPFLAAEPEEADEAGVTATEWVVIVAVVVLVAFFFVPALR